MNMEKIAKAAGVSKAAVSFALNDKPGISQTTRNHILKIAEELNYVPRKKIKKDTIVFFLITNNHAQSLDYYQRLPFFQSIIDAFKTKSYLKGYNLSIQTISQLDQETLSNWRQDNVYGVVVLGTFLTSEDVALLNTINANLIILDNPSIENSHSSVTINNAQGMISVVHHLSSQDSIIYVHGLPAIPNFNERYAAFKTAAKMKKLKVTEIKMDSFTFSETTAAEQSVIIDALQDSTTIVAENDYLALKIAEIITKKKLSHKVNKIFGFDNIKTLSQSAIPIKTVAVNVAVMVDIAIDLILKEHKVPVHVAVDTDFIEGIKK
ncbi:LacI family DNA-binding transcriptional regulator [Leuconostoc suionicum]|uniref:HTH-type transcriptional repressor CytR n=4 Tax=Lactobacillaceae TaxID=33958 RepID=A0A2N9K8P1_9LACO|nr:LacI family DNA-binding transcriptional regulator [Leuconostoc suionicum]API71923.1 hypothetical protein A6B45_04210 [Leuconostoc suionicum]MCT4402156.1 LacI family transcriptional regulator [Leuconostoc suionicum]MDI6499026.1 LacI family DNA-binding transcriptional regulator [Leuconostoc suionicum]MDI6501488.1 LacI family DNA-binding transcriptional regulator [Leuconostoc suionicum]MDI6523116.1 LacI family DNA-binding transcriptional regulator [Leuconostoc suionicum]